MFKILLLLIAGGLLIGAYIIRKGIGCLFTIIAIIIIGLLVVPFIRSALSDSTNDPGQSTENAVEQQSDGYQQVYFDELADELANGADPAKSKYLGQKIIIVGDFDKTNSEDDSIAVSYGMEDDNTLLVVGRLQTDEQRETSGQFSDGDKVVLKGTITDDMMRMTEGLFYAPPFCNKNPVR